MAWLEITIDTKSDRINFVAAQLTARGFADLVMEDKEEFETFLEGNRDYWDYIDEEFQQQLQGLSRIKLYLECDGTEQAQQKKLRRVLDALKGRSAGKKLGELEITTALLPETNWEESWKDNYPPQIVGEKLVVVPCWNPEAVEGRIPVILDPGLTFGTGAHPSTQMVMEFLERELKPGMTVIDLGSGSGILSIAALRLGAKTAIGVDIDPKAEDIARENAAYNDFGPDRFDAVTGNVTEDHELMARLGGRHYDLVFVNIVADVIIGLAPVLKHFMDRDTRVICSGILDVREQEVHEALKANGLTILAAKAKEDWRSLVAGRAEA